MKFSNKLTVAATNLERSINRKGNKIGNKITKFSNKLTVVGVGVVLGLAAIPGEANAASFEMVTNGEFEETEFTSKWKAVSESEVVGWETTNNNDNIKHRSNNKIELWNEGKISSPGMGSDGLGTGKHMETNFNGIETISQTFKLGNNIDTKATFSFDAWSRRNGTGIVSVLGSESGTILEEAISMDGSSWTQNLFELGVTAGEEITIAFQGDQANSVDSAHIDQVSFMVNKKGHKFAQAASVPEPASILGLLAVGAFSSASTLRRKKKQEA